MADSESPVHVTDDLDAFSELMFNPKAASEPAVDNKIDEVENEEVSEIETPSATEGNESEESEDSAPEEEDGLAEEGEDEVHAEDEESEADTKRRKSAKERIHELTAARREAERRADALERELAEARRNKESEDSKREVAPAAALEGNAPNPDERLESGEPKYPMGEFDPHYIRDLTRFTIQQERVASEKKAAEDRQRQEMESAEKQLTEAWTEKLEAAKLDVPNLAEKAVELEHTFRNLEPNYGKYLAATIMSLDYGPQVLDYLADHIGEAQKIVASGPTQATLSLGRLEARFAAAKERNEVEKGRVSVATPPPPRTRGASGRTTVAADTDDLDAFEKLYFAK